MKTSMWGWLYMAFMLSALFLLIQSAHAQETDNGTVIYEEDGLEVTVYAWDVQPGRLLERGEMPKTPISYFCSGTQKTNPSSYNVNARYSVEHKERTQLIAPSYEGFVRDKVVPGLIKLCGNITVTEITMPMYKMGEQNSWDIMTFNIADNGKTVTRSGYHPSVFAQANMSKEELAEMMPSAAPASLPTHSGGKQIYKDSNLTIYAREEVWCQPKNFRSKVKPSSNAGLDIVVPVDYDALHG